jgi:hypothetical protein
LAKRGKRLGKSSVAVWTGTKEDINEKYRRYHKLQPSKTDKNTFHQWTAQAPLCPEFNARI